MSNQKLVRDLMKVGVATCSPDTFIVDIAKKILEKNLAAVVVQNAEGQAVGVVTRKELARAYTENEDFDIMAEEIMDPNLSVLPPDIPIKAAVQIMLDTQVTIAYMMHNAGGLSYPAAYLSFEQILKDISGEEHAADVGIKAERKAPLDLFYERREQAKNKNLKIE